MTTEEFLAAVKRYFAMYGLEVDRIEVRQDVYNSWLKALLEAKAFFQGSSMTVWGMRVHPAKPGDPDFAVRLSEPTKTKQQEDVAELLWRAKKMPVPPVGTVSPLSNLGPILEGIASRIERATGYPDD